MTTPANCLYGLSAEFASPEELISAAEKARSAGYQELKAFSPYEVHGLSEVLKEKSSWLPWLVLIALFAGLMVAFGLQYWTGVEHYPINVGGRPYFSWPAFTPIMFELAILFAGLTAIIYMFVGTGLPVPYHPIFNTPNIETASRDHFFLCIRVTDAQFNMGETREFLEGLEPLKVSEVTC